MRWVGTAAAAAIVAACATTINAKPHGKFTLFTAAAPPLTMRAVKKVGTPVCDANFTCLHVVDDAPLRPPLSGEVTIRVTSGGYNPDDPRNLQVRSRGHCRKMLLTLRCYLLCVRPPLTCQLVRWRVVALRGCLLRRACRRTIVVVAVSLCAYSRVHVRACGACANVAGRRG